MRIVTDLVVASQNSACDHNEEEAVDGGGDKCDTYLPEALGHKQSLKTLEIALEHLSVAVDEGVRKTEHLNFLDHILVGDDGGIIAHLTSVLGAEAHIKEVFTSVNESDYS